LEADGKRVRLQIWDTAGQERFRNITRSYYRGAHGIILVFDVTDPSTFQKVKDWIFNIKKYSDEHIPVLLVGNKCDLVDSRIVDQEVAKDFAQKNGLPYLESSAKSGVGVDDAFIALSKEIIKKGVDDTGLTDKDKIDLQKPDTKQSSCCTII